MRGRHDYVKTKVKATYEKRFEGTRALGIAKGQIATFRTTGPERTKASALALLRLPVL